MQVCIYFYIIILNNKNIYFITAFLTLLEIYPAEEYLKYFKENINLKVKFYQIIIHNILNSIIYIYIYNKCCSKFHMLNHK